VRIVSGVGPKLLHLDSVTYSTVSRFLQLGLPRTRYVMENFKLSRKILRGLHGQSKEGLYGVNCDSYIKDKHNIVKSEKETSIPKSAGL